MAKAELRLPVKFRTCDTCCHFLEFNHDDGTPRGFGECAEGVDFKPRSIPRVGHCRAIVPASFGCALHQRREPEPEQRFDYEGIYQREVYVE